MSVLHWSSRLDMNQILVAALGIPAPIIIETGGQKALYAAATAIVGGQPKVALAPIPKF